MKKIYVLLLLFLFPLTSIAAGVSKSVQNAPRGGHAYTGNAYNKSILHTNEGIKGNYQIMKSQNSTGLIKPTTLTNTVNKPTSVPATPIKPAIPTYKPTSKYLPALYTYGWSSANDDKQEINVQNNTYNYYGATKDTLPPVQSEQNAKKDETNLQNSKSSIEKEREALKKKYANILSNKTMSNQKMCSKMESYFKNADYDELDRVLNDVLKLNCDIDKLRPDGVIK